ncbi:MAG: U32 family peptidase [Actinobacteria bacterium]|nr:U32 family peptidase [Actinomycetota bacterium]
MSSDIRKIELVAPAGGWDQLIAAINSGADSIYIGYRQFGARAYAENFDFKQLEKAAAISHKRGLKVYLTLNTILKDSELAEVLFFLNRYLAVCRDGIIIQDLGLYKILSDLYPGIVPLHASTQMNMHNSRSLDLLKDLGFKRVVLAREMTLDEIRRVKDSTEIDLEVFGHGSQCYCYSGSCYFSSFVGGRSGNRGRCTQPCRMKFALIAGTRDDFHYLTDEPSYLLSKSDLYTLNILPQIIKSGVRALKIEGRMKSPEYVAIVIKIYRKYIDLYYNDPGNYRVEEGDIYKLTQIFSRKLGNGYYNERSPRDIITAAKSGSIGNLMGRIYKIDHDKKKKEHGSIESIQIKSNWPIIRGDILEIWTKKGNKKINVENIRIINKTSGKYHYSINLSDGRDLSLKDRVFKSFDSKLNEEARAAFKDASMYLKDLTVDGSKKNDNIIPDKKINDYLQRFLKRDSSRIKKDVNDIQDKLIGKKPLLTVNVYNTRQLKMVLDTDPLNIVYCRPVGVLDGSIIETLAGLRSKSGEPGRNIIIDTPHIIYDNELKDYEKIIKRLMEEDICSFRVSNPGILEIFKNNGFSGKAARLFIGSSFNTSNILSVEFFLDLLDSAETDLTGLEFSPEINEVEIKTLIRNLKNLHGEMNGFLFSVFGHGFYRIMTARYDIKYYNNKLCKKDIRGYIEDQKRYRFQMDSGEAGTAMIYNSKKICTIFDLDTILESGINNIIIDGKFMEPDELLKVTDLYSSAISVLLEKGIKEYKRHTGKMQDNILFKDYSRGHFFRGID